MIVVVDSGPLIALSKVNLLFILREIFKEVYIPSGVRMEVVDKGKGLPGANEVRQAGWIKVKEVKDILACEALKHELGKGEAEAIILAKELNADVLIMDDKIPRDIARSMGLEIAGTLAVINEALERKIIRGSLLKIIEELRRKQVWISDELISSFNR